MENGLTVRVQIFAEQILGGWIGGLHTLNNFFRVLKLKLN